MNGIAPASRPQLDLAFARRRNRTVLDRRLFRWPFVLTRTFALDRVPAHLLTVILQTGSGAVHGEDQLVQRFSIGPGAAAHCTTQGASPIHRADPGTTTRDAVDIQVAPGGYFEHWPEARILFPDAALDQTIDVDCDRGGAVLVGDAFTVHDPEARGRSFRRLCSTLSLRCSGETLAIDRLDIRGLSRIAWGDPRNPAPLSRGIERGSVGLPTQPRLGRGPTATFKAFATLVLLRPGEDEAAAWLVEVLAAALAQHETVYAAPSLLPAGAGVVVRLASRELRHVRMGMSLVRSHIRHALYGAAPTSGRVHPQFDTGSARPPRS